MTTQDILQRLRGVRGSRGQWTAQCPAHDDARNSLSVSEGQDGRILLKCHAGCCVEDIAGALGLSVKDLFAEDAGGAMGWNDTIAAKPPGRRSPPVVATYTYPNGAQKLRRADKSFVWRRPDGKDGWIWSRKGLPHTLYIAGELAGGGVFVCEGEKDVDNLHAWIGGCAVSGEDGAGPGKWRKEYTEQLKGRAVCIFQDNDAVGRAFAQETAAALYGVASSVKVLDISTVWPEIPEHGDVSDLIAWAGTKEKVRGLLSELIAAAPQWTPDAAPPMVQSGETPETKPLKTISAPELQSADLPPVKYIIEGMLPDGTAIISAASKIGKSWMVLHAGLSIAAGQPFMGHDTEQCGVLYLALEDSLNRLQDRMNKILGSAPAPAQFHFTTEAPTLDTGLLDALDEHLKQHPETRLIIIDTLQKVRGQALPREAAYAQDYREMGVVKAHMDKKGVSVLFVHHNRKMVDADDPFNMISGTNAIMGAADTIWVITKDKRTDNEATLHVTGRDVAQTDTVITFDKDIWTWKPIGAADWIAEQRARLAYNDSPIVKTIKKLLEQSPEKRWDGTASELMEAGKYIARKVLAPTTTKLGHLIKALDAPLLEYDGIIHATTSHGNAGKNHSFYYQDIGFTELPDDEESPW